MYTKTISKGLLAVLLFVVFATSVYFVSQNDTRPPAKEAEEIADAPVPAENTRQSEPNIEPEILEKLKKTYASKRTSPARIRAQSYLSELPNTELPIKQFLEEITDPAAPTEYKLFLAKTLRNSAKSGLTHARRATIVNGLRNAIDSPAASEDLLAGLALVVVDIDESASTLTQLSGLLDRIVGDQYAAATVNAIARSSTREAKSALLEFARTEAESETPRILALSESLAPLSYEPTLPIEPILRDIVSKTQDARLFAASLNALGNRGTSEAKTQAISIARSRIASFPKEIQPTLLDLIQSSLAQQEDEKATATKPL